MTKLNGLASDYQLIWLDKTESLNKEITRWFLTLNEAAYLHRSHLFDGRYENIYVDEQALPDLALLMNQIRRITANILNLDLDQIKLGFWFNTMAPGHVTNRHNHDDDDEKVSGVYYLTVPANSGDLVLFADEEIIIEPKEGMLVLFSPTLEHEVLKNNSQQTRLSIGFNVGMKI